MGEKVSSEIPDLVRKRRARRNAFREIWGDIRTDPHCVENSELSYGFDVDCSFRPYKIVKSCWGDDYEIDLYGRLGLHCYNFQQGTNFKFVRWEKYSTECTSYVNFYVTLEAVDPASDSVFSFQTLFSDVGCRDGISIEWRTLACRIKGKQRLDDDWDDKAVDDFYKGQMPKWLSDEDLAADYKKYYVVQESELHEIDWLYLFSEIAFYSKAERRLVADPLLEIKNVVVQTKEDAIEAREKLKAENAIFYISYKYNGDNPSATGLAGDHKAIIRKTVDGKPGHMCLEVAE